MIKKLISALVLSTSLSSASMAANIPDNIALQRESMHALSLLLQMQAEGLQRRELNDFQQSMQRLARAAQRQPTDASSDNAALNTYHSSLQRIVNNLEAGSLPESHELDAAYQNLSRLLHTLHNPEQDQRFSSVLITDYLSMRYVFKSYVGIPETVTVATDRYYSTHLDDLLITLRASLEETLKQPAHSSLSARWSMLEHLFGDMQQGWTRTHSGSAYTPIVMQLNANVFSNQLLNIILE